MNFNQLDWTIGLKTAVKFEKNQFVTDIFSSSDPNFSDVGD